MASDSLKIDGYILIYRGQSINVKEQLLAGIQHFLPHHLISRGVHYFAESRIGWLKNGLICKIASRYNVDMSEAEEERIEAYENFNAFFTRSLKGSARPIAEDSDAIVSPADGTISQIGDIESGRILQAKGKDYSLIELLGGDVNLGQEFMGGKFVTVYLSPRDYHRVHIPATGKLRRMIHVPGRLFSVSPGSVENVTNLFARNERVVSIFDTDRGPMAVIMVGAIIVASIETVWAGLITPYRKHIRSFEYGEGKHTDIILERGDELGRFKMGSTAIAVFGKDYLDWLDHLQAGQSVKMGEALGYKS